MTASPPMREPRRSLLAPLAGFTLWSLAFVALYGGLSVGCEFGWDSMTVLGPLSLQRSMLIAFFLASIAGGWLVVRCAHGRVARSTGEAREFLERMGLLAGWAALAASLVTFGPVFFLSACN